MEDGEAVGGASRLTCVVAGLGVGAVLAGTVGPLSPAQASGASSATEPTVPVVLTGADLPGADRGGIDPAAMVAYRWQPGFGWRQIPVQVDERVLIDFGRIRGGDAVGLAALQYADPNTFTGADPDATLDGDDEVVLVAADAGGRAPAGVGSPPGAAKQGFEVAIDHDVLPATAYAYLFPGDGVDPAAGRDDVEYRFRLVSGDYKRTYKSQAGPNPETSVARTAAYQIGFRDRWITDELRLGPAGPNIIDGFKNRFDLTTCVRSNVTFSRGSGAVVANIDGPLRAVRSVIGANSGPNTERTTIMYADRVEARIDLRVHAIPGVMDLTDFSEAARGYSYQASTMASPVTIDGVADSIPAGRPQWEHVAGPTESLLRSSALETSIAGLERQHTYQDGGPVPGQEECWGDGQFLGLSGFSVGNGVPNTDPARGAAETLANTTTFTVLPSNADPVAAYRTHKDPRTTVAVWGVGSRPPSPSPSPQPPSTGSPPAPPQPGVSPRPQPSVRPDGQAEVRARAVKRKSRLRVRVRPRLVADRQWKFEVDRKRSKKARSAGKTKWRTLGRTYRTRGGKHMRTVNLRAGRYRATVQPRRNFRGATSSAVTLKR